MTRSKQDLAKLEDKAIEKIQHKLNDFLGRIAEKKEYQKLVHDFFKYSDEVTKALSNATEKAAHSPEAKKTRELLDQGFNLLGEFVGKDIVEKYRSNMVGFLDSIKDDAELKKWRDSTRDYILDTLKNPPQIDDAKAAEKMKDIIRQGRKVFQQYREPLDLLYAGQVRMFNKITNNPALQQFSSNLTNLASRLVYNERGQFDPEVMQSSIVEISNMMAGMFHNYLSTFPIESVEIHTNDYDITLSDIKLGATGLAPDRVQISTRTFSTLSFVEGEQNSSTIQISLSVEDIRPSLENFRFYFNKKSFPTYEDSGEAAIECTGDEGLSIRATLQIKTGGTLTRTRASMKDIEVNMGTLTMKSKNTQHPYVHPPRVFIDSYFFIVS
jgi:hypothetical protein